MCKLSKPRNIASMLLVEHTEETEELAHLLTLQPLNRLTNPKVLDIARLPIISKLRSVLYYTTW